MVLDTLKGNLGRFKQARETERIETERIEKKRAIYQAEQYELSGIKSVLSTGFSGKKIANEYSKTLLKDAKTKTLDELETYLCDNKWSYEMVEKECEHTAKVKIGNQTFDGYYWYPDHNFTTIYQAEMAVNDKIEKLKEAFMRKFVKIKIQVEKDEAAEKLRIKQQYSRWFDSLTIDGQGVELEKIKAENKRFEDVYTEIGKVVLSNQDKINKVKAEIAENNKTLQLLEAKHNKDIKDINYQFTELTRDTQSKGVYKERPDHLKGDDNPPQTYDFRINNPDYQNDLSDYAIADNPNTDWDGKYKY